MPAVSRGWNQNGRCTSAVSPNSGNRYQRPGSNHKNLKEVYLFLRRTEAISKQENTSTSEPQQSGQRGLRPRRGWPAEAGAGTPRGSPRQGGEEGLLRVSPNLPPAAGSASTLRRPLQHPACHAFHPVPDSDPGSLHGAVTFCITEQLLTCQGGLGGHPGSLTLFTFISTQAPGFSDTPHFSNSWYKVLSSLSHTGPNLDYTSCVTSTNHCASLGFSLLLNGNQEQAFPKGCVNEWAGPEEHRDLAQGQCQTERRTLGGGPEDGIQAPSGNSLWTQSLRIVSSNPPGTPSTSLLEQHCHLPVMQLLPFYGHEHTCSH